MAYTIYHRMCAHDEQQQATKNPGVQARLTHGEPALGATQGGQDQAAQAMQTRAEYEMNNCVAC
eukprot:7226108-Alexandrium_andersonii.AAC.1